MLGSLRRHGLVGSTAATIVAFAILVSLGTWQMQRKAWKEGLLQQIAERTQAPPISLSSVLARRTASYPEGYDPEYMRVSARGQFQHDKEQYVWAPDANAGAGYHVYTPMTTPDEGVVWVNRGWVPDDRKEPSARVAGQVTGDVTVTGLYRRAPVDKSAFTPDTDARRRVFYWRDHAAMQEAAFGAADASSNAIFIDADAEPANPGGWPKGGVTLLDLPNRHLEYAITWYGLAATLIAVYFAFVLARIRRARAPEIR